jgi:hypothetical protein
MSVQSIHKKGKKSRREKSKRKTKVTEKAFSSVPHLKDLAIFSKAYFRQQASFGYAFPPRAPVQRNDFILKLLGESVLEFGKEAALQIDANLIPGMAAHHEDLFEDLCSFVSASLFFLETLFIF